MHGVQVVDKALHGLMRILAGLCQCFAEHVLQFLYCQVDAFRLQRIQVSLFSLFVRSDAVEVGTYPFQDFFLVRCVAFDVEQQS